MSNNAQVLIKDWLARHQNLVGLFFHYRADPENFLNSSILRVFEQPL